MPVFNASTVYNAMATAFGLVMILHALASGRPVAPIWYAVVIVFATSAWTSYRVPPRWIARLTVALNAMLAFLIAVILAVFALQRDQIEGSATATAPQILVAVVGLVIVTSDIRRLVRLWQAKSVRSEGG